MAEYPNFKHGTRGEINADAQVQTGRNRSKQAIVYIGTAPVHLLKGGANQVNKPILVNNISEAKKLLGYSDDWENYTLCEAMHVHFELNKVGPLVFINVLDPATHRKSTATTASLTPANGKVTIASAENVIVDTIVLTRDETTIPATSYTVTYDYTKKVITIQENTAGALGSTALTVTYYQIDPTAVTTAQVVGTTDTYGTNTGVYAVKSVYNVTGYIPAFLVAPGFSSIPAVHTAMWQNSQNISGHWNAWMFVDMPITDDGTAITLATAPTWKTTNGYNHDNESVFFPLAKGTDGKVYHLSCLNAANFQTLLIENDGVPYMSGSNTECAIIEDLYFGENVTGKVYDDEIINRCLNGNGINSAAFVGGRWAIWGMFAGSFNADEATSVNTFDTAMMMLYYLTNDFQHRRNIDVDKPMPVNTLKSIVAEEQARVDALLGIGALTYGKVQLDATKESMSDMYLGDFRIAFDVTTTPAAKSLTAIANWTSEGFAIYFQALSEAL